MQSHRGGQLPETRRREQAAFMLPIAGALLIVPPLLTLFRDPTRVFGAPLATVYLFTVWVLLILGAVLASRRMPLPDSTARDGERRGDG
jgi:hypothetical protein